MGAHAWRTFDLRKLQRVFPTACATDPYVEVKDDGVIAIVMPELGPHEPGTVVLFPGWTRVLRQLAWQLTYLADELERDDMLVSCAEVER